LANREAIIDHELRILSATSRIRPLGRDRYFNRYFWLDAAVNAVPPVQPLNVKRGFRSKPTDRLDWGSGRLLVEFTHYNPQGDNSLDICQSLLGGRWGYYSRPDEIDQLISYLDSRGSREHDLKSNLRKFHEIIVFGMKKRSEVCKVLINIVFLIKFFLLNTKISNNNDVSFFLLLYDEISIKKFKKNKTRLSPKKVLTSDIAKAEVEAVKRPSRSSAIKTQESNGSEWKSYMEYMNKWAK